MLAQVQGLEGGGGAAVQLLKSPCDSERGSLSRRHTTLGPSHKRCPLFIADGDKQAGDTWCLADDRRTWGAECIAAAG